MSAIAIYDLHLSESFIQDLADSQTIVGGDATNINLNNVNNSVIIIVENSTIVDSFNFGASSTPSLTPKTTSYTTPSLTPPNTTPNILASLK